MENNLAGLELMSKEELLDFAKKMVNGGITLSFNGKRTAQVIERKVMPRIIKINKKLSFNVEKSMGKIFLLMVKIYRQWLLYINIKDRLI